MAMTPDGDRDGLNLTGHLTGNPMTAGKGTPLPSAGMSWGIIVGGLGILALLWFLFKSVRV